MDSSYTSDETTSNVVYVNTHAQLEAMRDEALGYSLNKSKGSSSSKNNSNGNGGMDAASASASGEEDGSNGPRVLVVGPRDSGKTSLVKVLTTYGEFIFCTHTV